MWRLSPLSGDNGVQHNQEIYNPLSRIRSFPIQAGTMSSGFEQILPGDNLAMCVVAPVSQDLCLTQAALTWYLALPSS